MKRRSLGKGDRGRGQQYLVKRIGYHRSRCGPVSAMVDTILVKDFGGKAPVLKIAKHAKLLPRR